MISCQQVWRELSNFIDGDIDPDLRAAIEDHLCRFRCCAALNGSIRNLVCVLRDESVFQVPRGYSQRLREFLTERMEK